MHIITLLDDLGKEAVSLTLGSPSSSIETFSCSLFSPNIFFSESKTKKGETRKIIVT